MNGIKIIIYIDGETSPVDVWENYPVVPTIGDCIVPSTRYLCRKVKNRIFYKDSVKIIIK